MSHHITTIRPPWSDRVTQRNDHPQLQLGLDEELPVTATLPSWEGLPDAQRADVLAMLARLLAKAGLSVEQRSA